MWPRASRTTVTGSPSWREMVSRRTGVVVLVVEEEAVVAGDGEVDGPGPEREGEGTGGSCPGVIVVDGGGS